VVGIILAIAAKALRNGTLDRDIARERVRDARLARLVSELPSDRNTPWSAVGGTGKQGPTGRGRENLQTARKLRAVFGISFSNPTS